MGTPTRHEFELKGADGGPLRGDVRTTGSGSGRPAVVVCHGFKGFKDWGFFPHFANRLARAGVTAVTFNFSGSGVGPDGEHFTEPQRFARSTISNDLEDLERVVVALLNGRLAAGIAAPLALGLHGHSRGGAIATLFAAGHVECRALVTWAAISELVRWDATTLEAWRRVGTLDVVNSRTGEILPLYPTYLDDIERHGVDWLERAARGVRVPWLLLHGAGDESVPVVEARRLHGWADSKLASLEIVPDGTHTFGARHPWAGSTMGLDRVMDETVGWFARHLM